MIQRLLVPALLALVAVTVAAPAAAQQLPDAPIKAALQGLSPDLEVGEVRETPLSGIYEVMIGGNIVYVSGDGRYMFQGELLDLEQRRSLTEPRRMSNRAEALDALGEAKMLVYGDEDSSQYHVTVFTDIDCPYCRNFHEQMQAYNERGIRVRYVLMPRAGIGSGSYDKAVWAWCADDPHQALTRAKRGESIAEKSCENPVEEHYNLALSLGIRATPTIVTEDGSVISGFRPPEVLEALLAQQEGGNPEAALR